MPPFVSKRTGRSNAKALREAVWKKIPPSARETMTRLFSTDPQESLAALKVLEAHNPKSFLQLFKSLARSSDVHTANVAIGIIGMCGARKDLPFINRMMYSPLPKVRSHAIYTMAYCNEPESLEYLQERLKHADMQTRKSCVRAISYLKPREYELYAELSEHSPFKDSKRSLARIGQIKDGSTTVLLGGKLYDKAIIRGGTFKAMSGSKGSSFLLQGITPQSFEAWKKAFEHNWKDNGLAHNPIEPLLQKKGKYRAYKNKDGTYRVSTGVIHGTSLYLFTKKPAHNGEDRWATVREIKRQKTIIDSTLTQLKIKHSHDHPANYLVEMVEGKPRLYIIDFDAAFIENAA